MNLSEGMFSWVYYRVFHLKRKPTCDIICKVINSQFPTGGTLQSVGRGRPLVFRRVPDPQSATRHVTKPI